MNRVLTPLLAVAIVTVLWAGTGVAGGVEPDSLTLRVHDATAPPGGIAAIVLRTYAARPIRQGQICISSQLQRQIKNGKNARLTSKPRGGIPAGPFASLEGAVVFSDAGDAVETTQFLPADQLTMVDFSSVSGTVNASDGPMLVLYYRLRDDLLADQEFAINIDLANTALTDADGQPILVVARNGSLHVRAPTDPINVSASAEAPDEFKTVMLSLQTDEPIAVAQGQLGLHYSNILLPGQPKIVIDPRYGNGSWEAIYTRELIIVQFSSLDHSLNTVPGDILSLYFEIDEAADPAIDRSVWLDPAHTFLYDSEGTLLNLVLEGDVIP